MAAFLCAPIEKPVRKVPGGDANANPEQADLYAQVSSRFSDQATDISGYANHLEALAYTFNDLTVFSTVNFRGLKMVQQA